MKASSLKVLLLGELFKLFQIINLREFIYVCESTLFLFKSSLAEKETQGEKVLEFRNT